MLCNVCMAQPRFTTQGPKRRRRTRRGLPYGQVRRWGATVGNMKRERLAKLAPTVNQEW